MISPRQFGSSLRRQRERQNITVKMLEARTKISASLLTGLEKGDCSRWPAGIVLNAPAAGGTAVRAVRTAVATTAVLLHLAGVAGGVGSASAGAVELVRSVRAAALERERARARESTLVEAA